MWVINRHKVYYYLHLLLNFPRATCLGINALRPRKKCGQQKADDPWSMTHKDHFPLLLIAWSRGLDLVSVSSLCLIRSESRHGFCHFHLNCNSHWWWLLFHLHSFPDCPPRTANFFIDNCPMGTICKITKFHLLDEERRRIQIPFHDPRSGKFGN